MLFSSSSAIFYIPLTCRVFKYDPFYTFLRKILLFTPKMSRIKFSLFCLQAAGCTSFESHILESFWILPGSYIALWPGVPERLAQVFCLTSQDFLRESNLHATRRQKSCTCIAYRDRNDQHKHKHLLKNQGLRGRPRQRDIKLDLKCEYEKYKFSPKPKAERWLKLQKFQGASNIVWL